VVDFFSRQVLFPSTTSIYSLDDTFFEKWLKSLVGFFVNPTEDTGALFIKKNIVKSSDTQPSADAIITRHCKVNAPATQRNVEKQALEQGASEIAWC